MIQRLYMCQIAKLKKIINDKYCDPYVEVGTVNEVLNILGYQGHFEHNERTGKVVWRMP